MIKKRKIISLALTGALVGMVLTGCSSKEAPTNNDESKKEGEIKKIGITQLVEHPALDATKTGFLNALKDNGFEEGKNIEIDFKNAQNDMPTTQTIASSFASDKKDLIFAISTPSAQAAFNATKDIPILFTAVTDPVEAGLVKTTEKPEGNVTGTSDFIPVSNAIALIKNLVPKSKTVGIIGNTSEINSKIQIDEFKKEADKNGFTVVVKGITTSNEVNQAVSSLVGKVDVIYTPTDNLVASSMPIIAKTATENKIPVIGAEEAHVKNGALACNGISYEKLGYKTGEEAIKILSGEKVSAIPVSTLDNTETIINETTLNALGIEKPKGEEITFIK
jgi:putative ABC transport system substrate-binding protein